MSIAALTITAVLAGASAYITSQWSGSRNLPTDDEVDKLVADAQRRRASGVHDHDDTVPGELWTFGEFMNASVYTRPLFSEAQIDAASEDTAVAPLHSQGTICAWLSGGYNNPKTHDEIDAYPPCTQRGAIRSAIPHGVVFPDEPTWAARLPSPTGCSQVRP